ncbi:hypothetical protein L9G74_20780, partial [Shewanella sp. C32]
MIYDVQWSDKSKYIPEDPDDDMNVSIEDIILQVASLFSIEFKEAGQKIIEQIPKMVDYCEDIGDSRTDIKSLFDNPT